MLYFSRRSEKDVKWLSKLESRPENPEKKVIREKLRSRPSGRNETAEKYRGRGPMVSEMRLQVKRNGHI